MSVQLEEIIEGCQRHQEKLGLLAYILKGRPITYTDPFSATRSSSRSARSNRRAGMHPKALDHVLSKKLSMPLVVTPLVGRMIQPWVHCKLDVVGPSGNHADTCIIPTDSKTDYVNGKPTISDQKHFSRSKFLKQITLGGVVFKVCTRYHFMYEVC
jgi:hypothetical protein